MPMDSLEMETHPDFVVRSKAEPEPEPEPEPTIRVSDAKINGLHVTLINGERVPAVESTDRTEGGMLRYNSGKHRMTLIPASFGEYTAAVLEYGAIKYNANNWKKGGSWTSALDSLKRHYDAFAEGEDCDEESGLPHLAHMAFNVMILIEFFDKRFGQDDRFRYPGQSPARRMPGRLLTFNQPPEKKS